MTDLAEFLSQCAKDTDTYLDQLIPANAPSKRLVEAMRYSALGGGKRIRPALALATAEALGIARENVFYPACALEMIHVYSLIHDDLPAMDDDDLRRGKPTCHKAYDEATAILAGDALQTQAFFTLTMAPALEAEVRLAMVKELAAASGQEGMAAGQAIDLSATGSPLTVEQLETMHLYKTGALIEASIIIGALCGGLLDKDTETILRSFARSIGLAFQVKDDILDVEAETDVLGKRQGADAALNKPTYVSILGLEGAKNKCQQLRDLAFTELSRLKNADTAMLEEISRFIVDRPN